MCLKLVSLALMCLSSLAAQRIPQVKGRRQVGLDPSTVTSQKDHASAGSGFVDLEQPAVTHHAAGGKYFQDMYMAQQNPKEIEFGHVAENPSTWEQRFEKINLENLNRQGKVRWGDKNGGYGEHYWDFNHAGHGKENDGEESQLNESFEEYPEETKHVPLYGAAPTRGKRNPDEDVEFINDKARSLIFDSRTPKHGGNYRRPNKESRSKREPEALKTSNLFFDQTSGTIVDHSTGIHYQLQAVPS